VIVILEVLAWIVLFVLAYLCGSIPFGLVIGKLFYHVDVRDHGSGNVGTTNVMRVLGKRAGAAVLICDMLKGYIPAIVALGLAMLVWAMSQTGRPWCDPQAAFQLHGLWHWLAGITSVLLYFYWRHARG